MRIRHVEILDHPGIGDLSLSFADAQGSTYPIVILAGGNGTGKTTILEAVHRTFDISLNANIGLIKLEIECTDEDVGRIASAMDATNLSSVLIDKIFTITYDSNRADSWAAIQLYWNIAGDTGNTSIISSPKWKDAFKCFLSEAAINFNTGFLTAVTTLSVDAPSGSGRRSGEDLGKRIGQLIIDIRAADAEDLQTWVSKNPGLPVPPGVSGVRFSRFINAFHAIFPHKRFLGVTRKNDALEVEFEEFGKVSSLNKLSTGEKQIVFRAGFLLQNLKEVSESIVLVDEPELSLHPEWQSKIISFYTALLSDGSGKHPQIIVSTHSPFIVHGAVGAKPIILEKNAETGKINEMVSASFPSSSGATAVQAFNIDAFLQEAVQPLLILVEGVTDADLINLAWKKLRPSKGTFFEIRPSLGDRNISITLNDEETFNRLGSRILVGIFDFDSAYNQWNGVWKKQNSGQIVVASEADGVTKKRVAGGGYAILLPVPSFRSNYASNLLKNDSVLSIEFMFDDVDIPPNMVAWKNLPMGAKLPFFRANKKVEFVSHARTLPASSFGAFEPLFELLDRIRLGNV